MSRPNWNPIAMPYAIETERLRLRAFEVADAPELLAAVDASRSELERWTGWAAHCRTPTDALVHCRRSRGLFELMRELRYVITTRTDGQLAGGITVAAPDAGNPRCVIEYWIRTSLAGRGFASEALRAAVESTVGAGAARVELMIEPNNRGSRAVATKVGFRQEGLLRSVLQQGDRLRDMVAYGFIPADARRAEAVEHAAK